MITFIWCVCALHSDSMRLPAFTLVTLTTSSVYVAARTPADRSCSRACQSAQTCPSLVCAFPFFGPPVCAFSLTSTFPAQDDRYGHEQLYVGMGLGLADDVELTCRCDHLLPLACTEFSVVCDPRYVSSSRLEFGVFSWAFYSRGMMVVMPMGGSMMPMPMSCSNPMAMGMRGNGNGMFSYYDMGYH